MIRTIVVDDEILSRIGISSMINGKEDIEVSGMFHGAVEALDFLRANRVDVVITDIEMSEMSGLEFIAHIRDEKLAAGIIILSCHENFAYAQEAIAKGTNSYLLKVDITEEVLIREVKKVYEETKQNAFLINKRETKQIGEMEEGIYIIGILRIKSQENEDEMDHLDGTMLVKLLEDVVARHQMGTFFAPYNREMFIIFRFDRYLSAEKIETELMKNLSVISESIQQYINGKIVYGISRAFTDLQKTRERYDEAMAAIDLCFYGLEKYVYRLDGKEVALPELSFSDLSIENEKGPERFEQELRELLRNACGKKIPVEKLKEGLLQGLNSMIFKTLSEYSFSQEFTEKWNLDARMAMIVAKAYSADVLEKQLIALFDGFCAAARDELKEDDLADVFHYIEQHLEERIALSDLTATGNMSTAAMCRKFKKRTGVTITQYINERRIERAKSFMKNPQYSLWRIAELTGFANVNYLIRVFKKVTGITVGEYRRQLGQEESEE